MEPQKTLNSQNTSMHKEQWCRNCHFKYLNINMYYRAIVKKTIWCLHKYRHVDQWNKIEDLDMNTHHLSFLYLSEMPLAWAEERKKYSTNSYGNLNVHMQKNEMRSVYIYLYKANSKCKPETVRRKHRQYSIWYKCRNIFLNSIVFTLELMSTIDKLEFLKLKKASAQLNK